jgi:hypothetical protein
MGALLLLAPLELLLFIAGTVRHELSTPSLISPSFLYYFLIIAPSNAFSVLFGFFNSFRGYRIRDLIVEQPLFLCLLIVVSRGFGRSGTKLRWPRVVECQTGGSHLPLRPLGLIALLFDAIYVVVSVALLRPACGHLVEIVCDDTPIDFAGLLSICFEYGGLAALGGLIRTVHRLGAGSVHWMEGHLTLHAGVTVGVIGVIVIDGIARYGIPELQVMAAFAILAWGAGGVALCVGAFFSFVWSFVTVLFGFGEQKQG